MKKFITTLVISLIVIAKLLGQPATVTISGQLDFLKGTDSVKITVYKYFGFLSVSNFNKTYSSKVTGNRFSIKIPAPAMPSYVFIDFSRLEKNINYLMIEPGDNIQITEKGNSYNFSGKNSAKYNIALSLNRIYARFHPVLDQYDPNLSSLVFRNEDSTAINQLRYLEGKRSSISDKAFRLMRNNVVSSNLFKGALLSYYDTKKFSPPVLAALKNYRPDSALEREINDLANDTSVIYNHFFLRGEMMRFRRDSCFLKGRDFDVKQCYTYMKSKFSGKVREALVTALIYNMKDKSTDLPAIMADALSYVQFPDFRSLLVDLNHSRLQGAEVFNFTLTDESGVKRTFEEFKGKVVLLDFWYTGCPSCAETAPYLAEIEKQFKGKPVKFISICIDKNKNMWLKSLSSKLYTSDYSINLYTDGQGSKHPIVGHYQANTFPTLILIDRNGKLCDPVGDPRLDKGERLSALINKAL
jgi:thiol-disulfide isomerase/thioredoxin